MSLKFGLWDFSHVEKRNIPGIQKKSVTILQVRFWFQKLAPSSKENSVPPIGAPKAAATPAAAPAETKSRLSLGNQTFSVFSFS